MIIHWLLLLSISFMSRSASAQTDTLKLVCYIEKMPELVTGGGARGITAAVYERVIFPPEGRVAQVNGRVFVRFTITPAGEVTQVAVAKSLWAPFDSAVVNAVRQLPCFKSRPKSDGAVRYTVPISFEDKVEMLTNNRFQYQATRKATQSRNSTR
jgi:TonB family protein